MTSLKRFFKQRLVLFFVAVFATTLLLINLTVYHISYEQYQKTVNRDYEAYTEMMVHLITMENMETALVYTEHYYHIKGIAIAVYDAQEVLLYETGDQDKNAFEKAPVYDGDGQVLIYITYDTENAFSGYELTQSIWLINGFSLLLFIVFLAVLYRSTNLWYRLLENDFGRLGLADKTFHFRDLSDVNDRMLALIESERKIKEYQRAYTKFLAHDIKTPLTIISAYIEGISLKKLSLTKEVASDIMNEIIKIEEMIPKFIDIDRETEAKEQDISLLAQSIIDQLHSVFKAKKIKIQALLDSFTLKISSLDFTRIFENLLLNALYYSPSGSTTDVIIDSKQGQLIIKDTGIGMDALTLKKALEGSFRSETAKKMHQKGSGLGLAIVRGTVERLGYQMKISSAVNSGTSVIISFR